VLRKIKGYYRGVYLHFLPYFGIFLGSIGVFICIFLLIFGHPIGHPIGHPSKKDAPNWYLRSDLRDYFKAIKKGRQKTARDTDLNGVKRLFN